MPNGIKTLSRRLKHGAKWLLSHISVPIRSGPLQGYRWSVATGARFVSGTYEPSKTQAYLDSVRAGDVVIDVGAHVGYYAVLASVLVGPGGRVEAFEPRPLNLRFLRRHIRINRVSNVRVWEAGVSDQAGQSRFETRTGTGTGRLSEQGDISVRTVRLDELFERGELPKPDFIKIDVEGGEMSVLRGGERLIREVRPRLLVATHGHYLHAQVTGLLDSLGYRYRVLDAQGHSGDTEILAVPADDIA